MNLDLGSWQFLLGWRFSAAARTEPGFGSALRRSASANFLVLNEGSSCSIPLAPRGLLGQVDAWKFANFPSGRPGD